MEKSIINTKDAPSPIGPYSQAVKAGNLLFTSGQIAIDPKTGILITDDIEKETEMVMKNLEAILKDANTNFEKVIKTGIFVKDLNNFEKINKIYATFFKSNFPARETVEVARLPKDANVEISMVVLVE